MSKLERKGEKKALKTAKLKGKAIELPNEPNVEQTNELLENIRALGGDEEDYDFLKNIDSEEEESGNGSLDVGLLYPAPRGRTNHLN